MARFKETGRGTLAYRLLKRKVGFHVSIAGGISNSVDNAIGIGCSAFQIFTRSPRRLLAKPLDPNEVELFRKKLSASKIDPNSVVVHMPYLPNLSGPPGEPYKLSVQTLAEETKRSSELGIPYLVIHLGSHMGKGTHAGMSQLVAALASARSSADNVTSKNHVCVLLENSAGQTNSIGATFEMLREILDRTRPRRGELGICLDTCHLFASGFDIRTKAGVESTLELFEKAVGLRELRLIHLNDSIGRLGSKLDRHEHIGLGKIGLAGLAAFLNHADVRNLPFIMETPIDERRADVENLSAVVKMLK